MQLVIIAGGKGTRLKEILGRAAEADGGGGGKPLLEHQVLLARRHGIRDIVILTGYGAEYVERYFGDGTAWDVRIEYQRELEPLGTAGALLDAWDKLNDTFLVMYGDTMVNVDLQGSGRAYGEGRAPRCWCIRTIIRRIPIWWKWTDVTRLLRFILIPMRRTQICGTW